MVDMQVGVAVAETSKRYSLCLHCLKFKASINTDRASPRALETRSVSDLGGFWILDICMVFTSWSYLIQKSTVECAMPLFHNSEHFTF